MKKPGGTCTAVAVLHLGGGVAVHSDTLRTSQTSRVHLAPLAYGGAEDQLKVRVSTSYTHHAVHTDTCTTSTTTPPSRP